MMKNLRFDKLLQRLGFKEPNRAFFEDMFLTFDGELMNLNDVLPVLAVKAPKDFAKMGKLLASTVDLEKLDNLSADEWLKDYISNAELTEVFQLSGAIITTIPRLEEMSASVLYETIQMVLKNREIWIAAEGLQEIFETIQTKIEENGGTILTRSQVQEIIIKNNRAYGVRIKSAKDGEYEEIFAPNIILAVPSWDLVPLIQNHNFPGDFVEKGHNTSLRTANVGLTALLPKPVYDDKRFFMVNFPSIKYPGCFFMLTNIAPKLAPKGKHLFDASIICNYDDVINDSQLRSEMIAAIKQDLNTWFPNWDRDAYWISYYLHYEEPKRTPGRVGKYGLGNKAPGIEALYFAGDCYASRALPGIECASESAMMCVNELLGI